MTTGKINSVKGGKVVGVPLDAEQLQIFERYKNDQFIRADAEAARKLMLERLAQIYDGGEAA